MQKNTKNNKSKKQEAKKLSPKIIAIVVITAIVILFQLVSLGKPHIFPFPPSIDSESVFTKKSLDDGSSLIVDSQGKRMLFTDSAGKLINIIETSQLESNISRIIEVSSNDDTYYVHGVKEINGGIYYSSESVNKYNKYGNFLDEVKHVDFDETSYVSSVDFIYDNIPNYITLNTAESTVHLDLSFSFLIYNLVYWATLLWLAIIIIVLLFWFIKNKLNSKTKIICSILMFVLITVCFYTFNNNNNIQDKFEETITTISKQSKATLELPPCLDTLNNISNNGLNEFLSNPDNKKTIDTFNKYITEICWNFGKEQSIYISIVSNSLNNQTTILADSRDNRLTNQLIDINQKERQAFKNNNLNEVKQVSNSCASLIYNSFAIQNNNGNDIAYVLIGSNISNVTYTQITNSINLFITLLAILIGIYVAISALLMCKDSIKKCLRKKDASNSERIVNLSGTYMLVYKFAYSIDSVLVVYIAGSLCSNIDPAKQAIYIAIPIALFYLGQWVGTLFTTPLLKKYGERNVALVSSIISIIIMIFLAWSVLFGDIILYSIGRGLLGFVVSGILYVISGTLPYCATNKEQKKNAIESSMKGSIAAAIITTLIGGYASEIAGFPIVYMIGAVMCGLLFLMTIITFGSKNTIGSQEKVEKNTDGSLSGAWRIFLKPELLMYIVFFAIPDLLISGYSSYIFPLMASEAGMSVVLLSNLGVFSLALMYICQNPINKFSRNFSTTFLLVVPSLAICIGLMCFLLSPNIYWAAIMMLLPGTFSYIINISEKVFLLEVSEKYNQNVTLVQSNYYSVYSALQTGNTPALSVFMNFGTYLGCVVLGTVCGAMYCIFGIYCRRTIRIKKNNKD